MNEMWHVWNKWVKGYYSHQPFRFVLLSRFVEAGRSRIPRFSE